MQPANTYIRQRLDEFARFPLKTSPTSVCIFRADGGAAPTRSRSPISIYFIKLLHPQLSGLGFRFHPPPARRSSRGTDVSVIYNNHLLQCSVIDLCQR